MEHNIKKCVLVLEETLPAGILANTAAILGITLGKQFPQAVGPDVTDQNGFVHPGIIILPVPVLRASGEKLRAIRERLSQPECSGIFAVDFSNVAQCCNVYDAFTVKAAETQESDFVYYGIGIYGEKKAVNRLTGNLPLLK